MADPRKPVFSAILRKPGKKPLKLELFREEDFSDVAIVKGAPKRYRVRTDGKWFGPLGRGIKKQLYTWEQFIELVKRSVTAP